MMSRNNCCNLTFNCEIFKFFKFLVDNSKTKQKKTNKISENSKFPNFQIRPLPVWTFEICRAVNYCTTFHSINVTYANEHRVVCNVIYEPSGPSTRPLFLTALPNEIFVSYSYFYLEWLFIWPLTCWAAGGDWSSREGSIVKVSKNRDWNEKAKKKMNIEMSCPNLTKRMRQAAIGAGHHVTLAASIITVGNSVW